MRKLSDTRFFQVLMHPSESRGDMDRIEEYYRDFIAAISQASNNPNNLFDFFTELNFIYVELKELIENIDYIDEQLPKNKCIKKTLKQLKPIISITEHRLKVSFNDTKESDVENNLSLLNLQWTNDKINLVEVGYSLYASKVINDGKASIKDIMEGLGILFNLKIKTKDIYRDYQSIRDRKNSDRTPFISHMGEKLLQKMEHDDNEYRKRTE